MFASLHNFFFFLLSKCLIVLKSYEFLLHFQLSVPGFCNFQMGLHRNSLATALTLKQQNHRFYPSAIILNDRATPNPQVPQWKYARSIFIIVLFFSAHRQQKILFMHMSFKINKNNLLWVPLFYFSPVSETYAIRKFPPVLEMQPLVVGEACLS